MTENKEKFVRADRVPTNGEIELAVERLSPGPALPLGRVRLNGERRSDNLRCGTFARRTAIPSDRDALLRFGAAMISKPLAHGPQPLCTGPRRTSILRAPLVDHLEALGLRRFGPEPLGPAANYAGYRPTKLLSHVSSWQCAPKARIISGGRIHPESCRLIRSNCQTLRRCSNGRRALFVGSVATRAC
jgi:hypothetical protein